MVPAPTVEDAKMDSNVTPYLFGVAGRNTDSLRAHIAANPQLMAHFMGVGERQQEQNDATARRMVVIAFPQDVEIERNEDANNLDDEVPDLVDES